MYWYKIIRDKIMIKSYQIIALDKQEDINWNIVNKAYIDENGWNSISNYVSFAQMVFIKDYGFIVKLICKEKNPWANCLKDGDPVYNDSCLEAFFLFDGKRYVNFETNSLGVRLQAIGENRHNRQSILEHNIRPVLEKDKEGWSITIDIPLSKIEDIYKDFDIGQIKSGFAFKGNFYKTGLYPSSGQAHYYMWNRINTPEPDFHQPSQFGTLIIK